MGRTLEIKTLSESRAILELKVKVFEKALFLFTQPQKLEENLNTILDMSCEVTSTEAGSILLIDYQKNDIFFACAKGPKAEEVKKFRLPRGTGIAGQAIEEKNTICVSDAYKDDRFYKKINESLGFKVHSIMASPIVWKGEAIGCIEVINKKGSDTFLPYEIELIEKLGRIAGNLIAIASKFRR